MSPSQKGTQPKPFKENTDCEYLGLGVRRTGQDETREDSMGKVLAAKPENSSNWNLIPEHHKVERRELTSTYVVWHAHSSSPTLHTLKINKCDSKKL